jgi:hypothetical protein
MGPLRSTMNFVNAHHRDLSAKLSEVFNEESFRRYEQHLDLFLGKRLLHLFLCLITLLRVYSCTRNEGREFVELICHQRNQGGDHQYESWLEHRGILVN